MLSCGYNRQMFFFQLPLKMCALGGFAWSGFCGWWTVGVGIGAGFTVYGKKEDDEDDAADTDDVDEVFIVRF